MPQAGENLAHRGAGFDMHPGVHVLRIFLAAQIRRGAGEQAHALDEGDAAGSLPLEFPPMLDGLMQLVPVHLHPLAAQQHQIVLPVEQCTQCFG